MVFAPAAVLPVLNIPNLLALCVIALVLEHYLARPGKAPCLVCAALLATVTFALLPLVKNAGSVFLGRHTPEALGDYFAGPNHTLPTSGTARFSSPLSVDDFVKKTQFIYYTREALADAAPRIADFAEREGLHGHARSALSRTEEKGE